MKEILLQLILVFLSFQVLFIITLKIRMEMNLKDQLAMPSKERMEKMLIEIIQMKRAGSKYVDCVEHLKRMGFRKGTARMIILQAEKCMLSSGVVQKIKKTDCIK